MRIFMLAALALGAVAGAGTAGLAIVGAQAAPQIDKLTMPKRYSRASIDFMCGNTKYSLSTGTGRGTCRSGKTVADCTAGQGNSAKVYCSSGCSASGKGSCKIP